MMLTPGVSMFVIRTGEPQRRNDMRLHEQRIVHLPIEEVFEYTADFSHIAEWDPGVGSSNSVSGGAVGLGSQFGVDAVFGSSTIPMVYEITVYEPPNRVVLVGQSDTLTALDEILFREQEGGTLIDYTADLTFHGAIRFVIPLMSPMMKRVGRRALDGLVARLEQ